MYLGQENRDIDVLHKNIAFVQNELTEENIIVKALTETHTAVLNTMTDLKQKSNTPEQNTAEHLSQNNRLKQRSPSCKTKIIQGKNNAK